jgi:hypothetical protein
MTTTIIRAYLTAFPSNRQAPAGAPCRPSRGPAGSFRARIRRRPRPLLGAIAVATAIATLYATYLALVLTEFAAATRGLSWGL